MTSFRLRPYQLDLKQAVYDSWNAGFKNVLAISPTGSGKAKTLCVLASELAHQYGMPCCIIVHRQELVVQLCMDLAELDIPHNIIAQKSTILQIINEEKRTHGKNFYNYQAPVTVVSVDTLNARANKHYEWCQRQRVWIVDEAAHLLENNKWGKAVKLLPNALGAGFTATPERLDKKGLGRHAFGVFDTMVLGPSVKWLISEGYLANYHIIVPKSDYREFLKDNGSETADFTQEARNFASLNSHIIGDVVKTYIERVNGKQTILFADSQEAGKLYEKEFLSKGISAKLLTGDTPAKERLDGVHDFAKNKIQVLINVDLFDEGFDVISREGFKIIEAVIMARPTKSISKFLQMFGRSLRPAFAKGYDLSTREGRLAAQAASYKPRAIVIDHVGNIGIGRKTGHGLPDKVRQWTLDNIVKRRQNVNLIRICQNITCNLVFDRALHACPFCGCEDKPYGRRSSDVSPREALKLVDGDMELLDPDTIRHLEKEMDLEDPYKMEERITRAIGKAAGVHARKNQLERIEMQKTLVQTIALWCGREARAGYTDRQIKKRFAMEFGDNITVVLSEPRAEMERYNNWIKSELGIL